MKKAMTVGDFKALVEKNNLSDDVILIVAFNDYMWTDKLDVVTENQIKVKEWHDRDYEYENEEGELITIRDNSMDNYLKPGDKYLLI